MLSQEKRQFIIENLQDSLRMVRHLMEFNIEDFADAIGVTVQTINDLETKKLKMLPLQYIAIAALADNYFMNHEDKLENFKEIIDSDGKNYDAQYETSFRDNSLLKRWFEDFIFPQDNEEDLVTNEEENYLLKLVQDYKVFLDAKTLIYEDAEKFVENLTLALAGTSEYIIIPLRSIEELQAEVTPEEFDKVLALITKMQTLGVAKIFGDETDTDFYLTIWAVFERLREKYNLCLITPNEYLAYRILLLREKEPNNTATDDLLEDLLELKPEEFIVEPAFLDNGKIRFYNDEILTEKFEDREKTVHLDIKNIPNCWDFNSDTEDEEKEVPPEDKNTSETKKFSTWEEL